MIQSKVKLVGVDANNESVAKLQKNVEAASTPRPTPESEASPLLQTEQALIANPIGIEAQSGHLAPLKQADTKAGKRIAKEEEATDSTVASDPADHSNAVLDMGGPTQFSGDEIYLAQADTAAGSNAVIADTAIHSAAPGAAAAGAAESAGAVAVSAAAGATGATVISGPMLLGGGLGLAAMAGGGGGGGTSAPTPAVLVPDTTAPAVAITAATDNVGIIQGTLASGASTDDTSLVLTGTVEAGVTVAIYNGAALLGAAVVSGSTWTYTASVANATTYQFNAKATDAAGNVSAATGNFVITGDTAAPSATAAIASVNDNYGLHTGVLSAGATTDDTSLGLVGTITGTLGSGEVVAVYDGTTRLGAATVSGSNWTYTDGTLAIGDSTAYTVRVEDAVGNQGTVSSPAFVAHISAPTATGVIAAAADDVALVVGNLVSGGVTNDTALALSGTISGTLVSGDTVVVYDGTNYLGNATVSGSTWTYSDATLANGDAVSYSVAVRNAAGEQSLASAAFVTTIDTAPPSAPTLGIADNVGSILGALTSGAQTDDTSLVLAGTTEAGSTVNVYNGSTLLGQATVTGTAWTYTAAVTNPNTYQFNSVAIDLAGNVGAASTNFSVTVDTAVPSATAAINATADNFGLIQTNLVTGGVTDDTSLDLAGTIAGTLGTGEVVAVYDGATRLGGATVNGSNWTYTDSTLANGNAVSYTVLVEDVAGNQGTASAAFTTTIDTAAPTATATITAVTDNQAPVLGSLVSGGVTNDTSLSLAGSIAGTLGAGEVVTVYDGSTKLGTATVSGSSWTYTDSTLADGNAVSYTVRVEDAAGNQGTASTAFTTTIDTVAPSTTAAIATLTDNAGVNQGPLASGATTDDTSLGLSGTLSAALTGGEQLAVYDGAGRLGYASVSGTTWTYTDSTLVNGDTPSYTVRVEDAAGNQGAASGAYTAIISQPTALATITSVADDFGNIKGNLLTGGSTDDTSMVLSGSFTGTLLSGEVLAVYDGVTKLGTATVSGTTWTYTDITLVDGDAVSYTVVAESASGDQGTPSAAFTTTIDLTAPATPVISTVADNFGLVQGPLVSGDSTDDTSLLITGTVDAGAIVNVYNGSTLLGAATVTGTGWTYTATVANGSTYQFNAVASDAAGNASSATSNFTVISDTTPSTTTGTLVGIADNVGNITTNLVNGGATDDTSLDLSGTLTAALAPGEVLAVYDGVTRLGLATVSGTGWTYTDSTLANGNAVSYTVRVQDAAGNLGTASSAFTTTIDTTLPTATAVIAAVLDNAAPSTGSLSSGGSTNDLSLDLSGTIAGTLGAGEVVVVYDGATRLGTALVSGTAWTYTDSTLANGDAVSYTVRVEDVAGNQGTASAPFTTTVDSTLPTAVANILAVADNLGSITGNLSSNGATDDISLDLSGNIVGTLLSGEVLAVYDGATRLGTALVNGSNWTYTDTTLANGDAVSYTVRAEDAAGNPGNSSGTFTTTIDTVAPTKLATITAVADNQALIVGNVASGGTSNDTSLALSGTLSAALTGNEVAAVYDNGVRLGYANSSGTIWNFNDSSLADGDTVNYTVRVEDSAGNQAAASAVFTVTIDTTVPSTTAAITAVQDNFGISHALASGDTTDDTSLDLSGTLGAALVTGEILGVYDNGVRLGSANVIGTTWTYTDLTLANGDTPLYTVRVEDAAGNQGPVGNGFGVTISQPTNLAIITTVFTDTGANASVANNGSTRDLTPVLNGTYSGTLGSNVLAVYDSNTYLGDATVNTANSTWSYADTVADGNTRVYNVVARTTAGDQGTPSSSYTVLVSTALPAAPVITAATDNVGTVTGVVASGGRTNDTALELTGTNVAGTTVQVFNGLNLLGEATVSGTSWTYTATVANGTSYDFNAKATNGSGSSGASTSYAIIGDTTAIAPFTPNLLFSSDTGTSNSDKITYLNTPTFTGGGAEAGATVALKEGVTTLGTGIADGSGNWSIAVGTALAEGAHLISASQVDVAGNVSGTSGAQTVTIDNTAPKTGSASFSNSINSIISLAMDEAVYVSNGFNSGFTILLNPTNQNSMGFNGTHLTFNTVLSGTALTFNTVNTLSASDAVRIHYDDTWGTYTDAAGNAVASYDLYVGGSGNNTIDLSNWTFGDQQKIRGNSGADTLSGSAGNDVLVDGGGADVLSGGYGADTIRLVEDGVSSNYARDVININMGESIAPYMDVIAGTNPYTAGTGFDIASATAANHDQLSLVSNVIQANVSHFNGTDVNTLAQHSITSGIVTFENTAGTALVINQAGVADALTYLGTNISAVGNTVAFKVDTDNNGTVDALYVFQKADGVYVRDTVLELKDLTGIGSAVLGTTEGANVVQLVDTTRANSSHQGLVSDGVQFVWDEAVIAPASIAMDLYKNGSTHMTVNTATSTGSGTNVLTLHTDTALTQNDWVLARYHGSSAADGLTDLAGNGLYPGDTSTYFTVGGDGNNTIDISGLTALSSVHAIDGISGGAGDDILIGDTSRQNINGGSGADTMTGNGHSTGTGNGNNSGDTYGFEQGDSPLAVVQLNGSVLGNGSTFTFANGVDRITDFSSGDRVNLDNGTFKGGMLAPIWMAPENSNSASTVAAPVNGLATDQHYFFTQGNFSANTFTVSSTGIDTLVVYDGDATAGVTQTGLVLSGTTLSQINAYYGNTGFNHV